MDRIAREMPRYELGIAAVQRLVVGADVLEQGTHPRIILEHVERRRGGTPVRNVRLGPPYP